jgi:parallel beta-helix repeat protein
MGSSVNVSSELTYGMPCLTIRSGDVTLNCNGHDIYNSTFGIVISNSDNVTLSGCNVSDSITGITLEGSTGFKLYNSTLSKDNIGMAFSNSGAAFVSGAKAHSGTYGAYLLNSYSDTLQNFNFSDNIYGIYLSNSIGDVFNKGTMLNNSRLDVYATPDSANSGYDTMLLTSCGYTNALWATCKQQVSTNLTYTPISACGIISKSGNYSLTSNVVYAQSKCITIATSNVTFSCDSHSITAALGSSYGVYVNNDKNVTVNNCRMSGFAFASIGIYNSSKIMVAGTTTNDGKYGVLMSNVSDSTVFNTTATGAANASIYLNHVVRSNIIADNASYGLSKNSGIQLSNSTLNNVLDNLMVKDYAGMYLNGSSQNNTISNNTAEVSSGGYDYVCNGNGGIDSEQGGINYGGTKSGCHWLAVLSQGASSVQCAAAIQTTALDLANDGLYGGGATCFSVYSPDSSINCHGHTVIALNGGTFAAFKNSQSSIMQNCYLKGFSTPVTMVNSTATVLNNTMLMNQSGAAIIVLNSRAPIIQNNNITSLYQGINVTNSVDGYLLNNNVGGSTAIAYLLSNATSFTVQNNTASKFTEIGLYMTKSEGSQFQDNIFSSAGIGIQCVSNSSQGVATNVDGGSNACSSESGCAWIKSSASTCHS